MALNQWVHMLSLIANTVDLKDEDYIEGWGCVTDPCHWMVLWQSSWVGLHLSSHCPLWLHCMPGVGCPQSGLPVDTKNNVIRHSV